MGCKGCGNQTKSNIASTQTISESKNPSTMIFSSSRISCLECVEKHIGAAWVLYIEYKNGYPYKTLIIGHLNEAEAESEKWPMLSVAIREYRKRFQDSDIPPPFDFLALKILEAKQN